MEKCFLTPRAESGPWPWSNGPCGLQRAAGQKAAVAPVGQLGLAGETDRAGQLCGRGAGAAPEQSPRARQLQRRGCRRWTRRLDSSPAAARARGGCGECVGQLYKDEVPPSGWHVVEVAGTVLHGGVRGGGRTAVVTGGEGEVL
jgi:hypothetical protein